VPILQGGSQICRDAAVAHAGRRICGFSTGAQSGAHLDAGKIVLVAGVAALALGVYLVVEQQGRGESQLLLEAKIKELQEKERKIQTLEADAAKTRQTLTEQTGQLSELKAKLEESQKELASVRVRLGLTNREVDRLASSRSSPPEWLRGRPIRAPTHRRPRGGSRGLRNYQATSAHEDRQVSRVLSQIGPGTRINVVRSTGDWLEVRSKQGNPPGFVRLDDAKFIGRAK
jgi:uncharacterized coiled-coil protein SlyX